LNETTQSLKVTDDVKFTYQDYVFDVSYIEKEPNSDIINIYGKIKGGNPVYSILADKGEYNVNDKKIRIFGNVDITSTKGEKLILDNFVYSSETKEADIYGNKILYTSPTNNLEAEYIHYNSETKEVTTDKPFDSWNQKGEGLTGTSIVYNLGTKDFYSKENITVKNKDYGLTTKNVTYKEETGILTAPEPYVIKSNSGDSTVNGNSITYNKKTGELVSPGEIIVDNKGTIIKGHDLVYNNISGLGKIEGPIPFENKADNMSGIAKEIIIKKGDYVDLVGPIKAKRDTTNMEFANARYSYKDELVHVNTPVKFNDPVSSMVGSVSSATYNPKDSILKGTNFNMKEPDRTARAQNIVLYNKEERKLELVGNAYLSSGKDNISGPKIVYYLDTKDAETPTNSVINYDQYTIKSTYGKVNKESGEVFVKNADVKSVTAPPTPIKPGLPPLEDTSKPPVAPKKVLPFVRDNIPQPIKPVEKAKPGAVNKPTVEYKNITVKDHIERKNLNHGEKYVNTDKLFLNEARVVQNGKNGEEIKTTKYSINKDTGLVYRPKQSSYTGTVKATNGITRVEYEPVMVNGPITFKPPFKSQVPIELFPEGSVQKGTVSKVTLTDITDENGTVWTPNITKPRAGKTDEITYSIKEVRGKPPLVLLVKNSGTCFS